MNAVELIAAELGTEPERVRRLLCRLVEEGRGKAVDVGGLRGSWREGRVVLERYEAIDATPQELLDDRSN